MFTAENIIPDELLNDIKSKVSEYDIFKRYCTNFKEINKSFLSEFYVDTNPSCRIYCNKDNILYYKDFGTNEHYNCYNYVMRKYNCNYTECLRIIANDFNLFKNNIDIKPNLIIGKENLDKQITYSKPTISIVPRKWNIHDYNYWFKKYSITFEWLDSYDVIPCEYIYLHKKGKTIIFQNSIANPIYAYRFSYEGTYYYKIYKPLEPNKKYKWLFSGTSDCIEGYDQLPLFDDLLIITKSLKDVICCRLCDYSAISLQGENNKLEKKLANKLEKRFKSVILLYDNDKVGQKAANKLSTQYNYKSIFIPSEYKSKDLSELISKKGLDQAKIILNSLINNKNE